MCARIAAAMSGGVDSSAAAWLLKQQGHDVAGVTLKMFERVEPGEAQDIQDARSVAQRLGIPYHVFDVTPCFQAQVMDRFAAAYEAGETPNPCVDCNRYVKLGKLFRRGEELDCTHIATGHYAQVEQDKASGRWLLKKGLDEAKDQSYFLYTLTQSQLSRVQFPLGGMEKRQVRELAERLGFVNARRRDSQDICFIPGGDYGAFIESWTGEAFPAGDFLDREGRAVGRHRGAIRYTLGQRKGLGLSMGEPVYVCGKDMSANTVTVGPESALFVREILVEDLNWIAIEGLDSPLRVGAKTRSRQAEQAAEIFPESGGRVRVVFDRPQRAVTPGQAAVFYGGDAVVGGGTIVEAGTEKENGHEL